MMGVTFGSGCHCAHQPHDRTHDFTESLTMTSSPTFIFLTMSHKAGRPFFQRLNPHGINLVYHQKPKNETTQIAQCIGDCPTHSSGSAGMGGCSDAGVHRCFTIMGLFSLMKYSGRGNYGGGQALRPSLQNESQAGSRSCSLTTAVLSWVPDWRASSMRGWETGFVITTPQGIRSP